MRKEYCKPKIVLVEIFAKDVVTTSGGGGSGDSGEAIQNDRKFENDPWGTIN